MIDLNSITTRELSKKLDNLTPEDLTYKNNAYEYDNIRDIICEEGGNVATIFGLPFEFIDSTRDYSEYYWIFSLGDKTYRYVGSYGSYSGAEFDNTLQEITPVKKEVTVWQIVD